MIPLKDSQKTVNFPFITILLIMANTLAFFIFMILDKEIQNYLLKSFAFFPKVFLFSLETHSFYIPVFTAMFMHAGLWHLLGNMWALWIFGNNVEDVMGKARFLIFYILSGIVAILFHFIFNMNSIVPTVGASGAIAGVMGAYFILFKKARVLTIIPFPPFIFPLPSQIFLGLWFALQVFQGVFSSSASGNSVAWWAHIAGFIFGMIFAFFFKKLNKKIKRANN